MKKNMKRSVQFAFLPLIFCVLVFGCQKMGSMTETTTDGGGETEGRGETVKSTEIAIQIHELSAGEILKLTEHLQKAYEREYGASVKYDAWAEKAEKDGWNRVGALFRSIAKSEALHAAKYAAVLKTLGVAPIANVEIPEAGTVEEMLHKAVESEEEVVTVFYPAMIAELEKLTPAKNLAQHCKDALQNDAQHAKLYRDVLENLEVWKDSADTVSVCTVCGFIVEDAPPENCPKCGAAKEAFEERPAPKE